MDDLFHTGAVLGDYEIVDLIGKGGMGVIWRARQISLDRVVAIKVLPPEFSSKPDWVERFLREARATARLNHANLVSVFDAGVVGNTYFMVMEYVEGRNLGQVLSEIKHVDERTALQWIRQAAAGLAFAHRQGIVHRDVKPENLLLMSDGTVKVGDLGLVKVYDKGSAMTLTTTGETMGSPYCIATEQIQGVKDIDGRADIYSLGITLYCLLSGAPPFHGGTPVEVMTKHLTETLPPLRAPEGKLSWGTVALVEMMTAKDRRKRIKSMSEVVAGLDSLLNRGVLSLPGDSGCRYWLRRFSIKGGKWAMLGLVAVLVILGSLGIGFLIGSRSESKNRKGEDRQKTAIKRALPGEAAREPSHASKDGTVRQQPEIPRYDGSPDENYTRLKGVLEKEGLWAEMVEKGGTLRKETDATLSLNLNSTSIRELTLLKGAPLSYLSLNHTKVKDLSPLRGMPLKCLSLYNCAEIKDITPLKGLPLCSLMLQATPVTDLSPLRGMKIGYLDLSGCPLLNDLSSLKGVRATHITLSGPQITDISPLREMPLTSIYLLGTNIKDLSALQDMELTSLLLTDCRQIVDLSPLREKPLKTLFLDGCVGVKDLSPLAECRSLEKLLIPAQFSGRQIQFLHDFPNIQFLDYQPSNPLTAEGFWKKYGGERK
jgi:serine/threonine protein kinase